MSVTGAAGSTQLSDSFRRSQVCHSAGLCSWLVPCLAQPLLGTRPAGLCQDVLASSLCRAACRASVSSQACQVCYASSQSMKNLSQEWNFAISVRIHCICLVSAKIGESADSFKFALIATGTLTPATPWGCVGGHVECSIFDGYFEAVSSRIGGQGALHEHSRDWNRVKGVIAIFYLEKLPSLQSVATVRGKKNTEMLFAQSQCLLKFYPFVAATRGPSALG